MYRDEEMKMLPVMIALVACWVALSIAFMWPPICQYQGESGNACINNLRQIDGAIQQYMLETGITNGLIKTADLAHYLGRGEMLHCPCGGIYTYGNLDQVPTCSLATNPPPPAVKRRVGVFGWYWEVWPSPGQASHRL
jgi:hypothetical protein